MQAANSDVRVAAGVSFCPEYLDVNWEHRIDNAALVGDPYALGADRGDHQSSEKDSGTESHGQ